MKLRNQWPGFFWSIVLTSAFLALTGFARDGGQFITRLKSGKPQTIVTYGTSLTAGGAWVGQLQTVLQSKYPGLATVINSGQGAMWSKWGVDHLHERVLQNKPDAVFIEFAINDGYLDYQTTVEQGRKNLENMIQRILQMNAGCEIILMTMNPPIGVHLERRPKVAEYYQMYRNVAHEMKLMLIDHYRNWGTILEADERLYARYVPDGIHPNAEGCEKVITPAIMEALGLATDADFRPSIRRIELDREKVCADKNLRIRIDWQANAATRQTYQLTLNLVGIGRPPDFSTNIVLQPPTTQWKAGTIVSGKDFVITIPGTLSPGWRRMLWSLTQASLPGQALPLDNADRHERNSQYCFGEIEILPANSQAPGETLVRLPTSDPAKPERPNEEWRMRHAERVADVKSHADRLDVLFIGDSITGGWRDIGKAVWEKQFVPLRAVNIGIAGSQTQHLLWQFENGAIDGINPKVAVLMIGVNHFLASPSHTTADIARGISAVVAKLREKLPQTQILLLGTFPKDRAATSTDRVKIKELNAMIARLDDGKKIRFNDLTLKFLATDGSLPPDISPDGVHLSPAGYAIWADALRPVIREITAQDSSRNVRTDLPVKSSQ